MGLFPSWTLCDATAWNSLLTSGYRKPTHTDLYLHWDSHHHLPAKFSMINTLKHRAKAVCSNHYLLKEEKDHLNKALRRCKYPAWDLNRVNINQNKNKNKQGTSKNKNNTGSKKPYIVVPYMQGMSESCKSICRKHGVEMHFRGGNTIRDLLIHPKDRDTILQKSDLQVQVWKGGLWGRVHWGIRQNICRKVHRTHEGTITHPWPSQHHWSWTASGQLSIVAGGPEYCHGHQRGNIN